MGLLSYYELLKLQDAKIIENSLPEHVNQTSIDITLGNEILVEVKAPTFAMSCIELSTRQPLTMLRLDIGPEGYMIEPGQSILAQSQQVFNLPPHISAEYKLKSSMARIFLEHLNAGWCDAGWHGSVLTLELSNMSRYHHLIIKPGDLIGQVVFFKHRPVPQNASYATRGRYNNDKRVEAIKA